MISKYMFDSALPANIVRTKLVGVQPTDCIYGIVGDVVVKSAMKHPDWEFRAYRFNDTTKDSANTYRHAVEFSVHDSKGELVGKIGSDSWNPRNTVVEFSNDRIKKSLQRGQTIRTSKLNVALKHVERWFTPAPMSELMEGAKEKLDIAASRAVSDFVRTHNNNYHKVTTELHDYIMANIEQLKAHMNGCIGGLNVEQVIDNFANLNIAQNIWEAANTKKLTVLIQDDKYVVQREGQPFYVKTSDTIPESVRAAIGMLKLVNDGQFVRGIGFRHSHNIFLVIYDGVIDAEFQT